MSKEKRRTLVKQRANSYDSTQRSVGRALEALEHARVALLGMPEGRVVSEEFLSNVAVAYSALVEIDRLLPEVMCWCVVKRYDGMDAWKTSVWSGHTTRRQADAFAVAIQKHYDAQAKTHGWCKDSYVVDHVACRITQVMNPYLSADEYVATLR